MTIPDRHFRAPAPAGKAGDASFRRETAVWQICGLLFAACFPASALGHARPGMPTDHCQLADRDAEACEPVAPAAGHARPLAATGAFLIHTYP